MTLFFLYIEFPLNITRTKEAQIHELQIQLDSFETTQTFACKWNVAVLCKFDMSVNTFYLLFYWANIWFCVLLLYEAKENIFAVSNRHIELYRNELIIYRIHMKKVSYSASLISRYCFSCIANCNQMPNISYSNWTNIVTNKTQKYIVIKTIVLLFSLLPHMPYEQLYDEFPVSVVPIRNDFTEQWSFHESLQHDFTAEDTPSQKWSSVPRLQQKISVALIT